MTKVSNNDRSQPASSASCGGPATVAAVLAAYAAAQWGTLGIASGRHYDEGVYLLSARALHDGHALFLEVFSSQPPAFLEALALALRLGGDRVESARFLILVFSLVGLAAVADLGRRLGGWTAAAVAVAALATSETFLRLGHLVQAETPALATALVSLCLALEAPKRRSPGPWFFAAGATMGLALLFKLFVAPLVPALAALLLLGEGSGEAESWRLDRPWSRRVITAGCFLLAGLLVAPLASLLVYDRAAMMHQAVDFHVAKHQAYALHTGMNLSRIAGELAGEAVTTALALAGAAFLSRRAPSASAWLGLWIAGVVVALVGQTPLFWRHFVLITPPLVLLAGLAVARMPRRSASPRPARLVFTVLLALLLARGSLTLAREGSVRAALVELGFAAPAGAASTRVAEWLASNTAAGETVVGDDPTAIYLAGRSTAPALCDTSHARIAAGFLRDEEAIRESAGARVLVLRESGRLLDLKRYARWVERNYEQPPSAPSAIWIRREGGRVAVPR